MSESSDRHIWMWTVSSKGAGIEAQSLACGVIKRWITTVPTLPMALSIKEFILVGLWGGGPNGGSKPLVSSLKDESCSCPFTASLSSGSHGRGGFPVPDHATKMLHQLRSDCESKNLYSLGYFSQVICSNCDKKSHYHNSADHNWAGLMSTELLSGMELIACLLWGGNPDNFQGWKVISCESIAARALSRLPLLCTLKVFIQYIFR